METIDFNTVIAENISVVEGLIGINLTWIRWKGQIETSTDVNTIIEPGLYQILSTHSGDNKPPISGLMEVYGDEKGTNVTVQRVTSFNANSSVQRVKSSTGIWTEWG